MAKNPHTKKIGKEIAVRAGKRITYRGKEYVLRELKFALHCLQSGVSPRDGTPLTSNKGGAS